MNRCQSPEGATRWSRGHVPEGRGHRAAPEPIHPGTARRTKMQPRLLNRSPILRRAGSLAAMLTAVMLATPALAGDPVCTYDHWDADSGFNLAAGDPGDGHIRYAGPCSLRVDLIDAEPGWLENNSQQGMDQGLFEDTFNVRFYALFDEVTAGDAIVFEAYDTEDNPAITIWYQADDDVLVFDLAGATEPVASEPLGEGWHSVDMSWQADAEGVFLVSIDGEEDLPILVDTDGMHLAAARLGNVMSTDGAGHIFYDDYAANRFTRPGRLPAGDASGTGEIGIGDAVAILTEINELGLAPGVPDCNEDGSVGVEDAVCVLTLLTE